MNQRDQRLALRGKKVGLRCRVGGATMNDDLPESLSGFDEIGPDSSADGQGKLLILLALASALAYSLLS